VPFNLTDTPAIERLTGAINERYQRLDILIANAGLGGASSPLDHIQPKEWDEMLAVNVTANWQLLRHMHALLLRSDAGRVVVMSGNAAIRPRAYRGSYAMTKGALEAMARVYAEETAATPIRVTIVNPGPTRTKMRAAIAPGEDPMTLPTPDEVAATIVPLCLPSFQDSGKMWDFRAKKLRTYRQPE
jgi:NAD(P)-dependent dehydrogenase (short-subunit alcohol dehydrogenase family)